MNYKVLYRKYRPSDFNSVVGQNTTVELLKDSVVNEKISHAYIFSGPRGTGKTSTAKIFAKAINCLESKDGNPCGKCSNCINFTQSSDIYEIDAASNNGVDQIREIIDNIKLTPIDLKYKVYIIDEVHMLSTSAFNALLLTLEEPPSHVVFILATTDIENVPITVLSRCQRLDFRKISKKDIVNQLEKISKNEKIDIDMDAISEIAEYSDGGLRDALSILDQLSKIKGKITIETVLNSIGSISNKQINDLIEYLEKNDVDKIIDFCNRIKEVNIDLKGLIKKIIETIRLRSINIIKNNDVERLSYSDYKNIAFELSQLLYKTNVNVNSYTLLELILLNYTSNILTHANQPKNSKNDDISVSDNIDKEDNKKNLKIEDTLTHAKPCNESNYYEKLIQARINNCFVNANKECLNAAKKIWKKYITDLVEKKNKGFLLDSDVVLSSDDIMVIKADLDQNVDFINTNNISLSEDLNDKCNKYFKLIAVNGENWNSEMDKYKDNIKNHKVYKNIEEPVYDVENDSLNEVFNSHKIEFK